MLNRFKGYFSGKSAFQKKILSSSLISSTDEILLDDLLFLIAQFEQASFDIQSRNYIDEYFKIVLDETYQQSYLVRCKYLLTAHLMMHEFQIGLNFASLFLDEKFAYLQSFSQIKDLKLTAVDHTLWITLNVQLPYYQYLQRLAINIQVFHACKVQQYPFAGDNNKLIDIQTKILWLFKISNMVNNGLGQMETIKVALVQYPKELLLKEIVLVYWSDIIVYYNFLSKEILSLIDYYRHLPASICLQFYELYLQLFNIRNSIGELYKFKTHFDRDNVIKQPKWFDINKPLHKDIEQYMVQQRMEQASSKNKPTYNTDRQYLTFINRRVDTNPNHRRTRSTQIMSPQQALVGSVKLNLEKVKSYNELNGDKKEKIIQTHRPGRKYSYDEDDEDQDFEMLKQVLQKQNLAQRVTDKKEELRNASNQVSFQKTHQFD